MNIIEYLDSLTPNELESLRQITVQALYLAESKSDPDRLAECVALLYPMLEAVAQTMQTAPAQITPPFDYSKFGYAIKKIKRV